MIGVIMAVWTSSAVRASVGQRAGFSPFGGGVRFRGPGVRLGGAPYRRAIVQPQGSRNARRGAGYLRGCGL